MNGQLKSLVKQEISKFNHSRSMAVGQRKGSRMTNLESDYSLKPSDATSPL